MLDESVLEPPPEKARATVLSSKPAGPPGEDLRGLVRARLAEGRLPAVHGMSRSQRGSGRPCIVCRRAVEPIEVERELTGVSGAVLTAHEACYKPWREESRAWRDPGTAGEAADRLGATAGRRT